MPTRHVEASNRSDDANRRPRKANASPLSTSISPHNGAPHQSAIPAHGRLLLLTSRSALNPSSDRSNSRLGLSSRTAQLLSRTLRRALSRRSSIRSSSRLSNASRKSVRGQVRSLCGAQMAHGKVAQCRCVHYAVVERWGERRPPRRDDRDVPQTQFAEDISLGCERECRLWCYDGASNMYDCTTRFTIEKVYKAASCCCASHPLARSPLTCWGFPQCTPGGAGTRGRPGLGLFSYETCSRPRHAPRTRHSLIKLDWHAKAQPPH